MTFTVIICTYNPTAALLERVIQRVNEQSYPAHEIIVVDNNSSRAVTELPFIALNKKIICLKESRQGLAYARIAGFSKSSGDWIVFMDQDNVCQRNYLEELAKVAGKIPQVAIWGPGRIFLEYEIDPPAWLKKNFGSYFQERNIKETTCGNAPEWSPYHPTGSGMCVRRDIMEQYADNFNNGIVSAVGRKEADLGSADDSQIVWTAIKKGMQVGVTPELQLIHIIQGTRLSMKYLQNLQYNIGASYSKAFSEMFPDKKVHVRPLSYAGHLKVLLQSLLKARLRPMLFVRFYLLELAWFRGISDHAQK